MINKLPDQIYLICLLNSLSGSEIRATGVRPSLILLERRVFSSSPPITASSPSTTPALAAYPINIPINRINQRKEEGSIPIDQYLMAFRFSPRAPLSWSPSPPSRPPQPQGALTVGPALAEPLRAAIFALSASLVSQISKHGLHLHPLGLFCQISKRCLHLLPLCLLCLEEHQPPDLLLPSHRKPPS